MHRIFYVLLVLGIAAMACSQPSTETQQRPIQRDAPSATQNVVDGPTAVSKITLPSSTVAPTAASAPAPDYTAVSNVPPPTPTATTAPDPQPTPMATYTPRPPPTPAATEESFSLEDLARHEAFLENFKSNSFEAFLELPSRISDCECPVTANVSGWQMINGPSQMFAQIEMTEPVERSIEVVTRSSFDIYLKDLDEGRWYFIPENTDMSGPPEEIMSLPFMFLLFAIAPAAELEPVQGVYVRKIEGPPWGSITVTYDQALMLEGITWAEDDGQEILRARFFDLNEPHDIVPHEKGELLPDTYWQAQ